MNEFENLDPQSSESGFGMIEIIVSMFLLALLAVAFLPLLINTLQLGPKNAAIAAGNQLVADGLTQADAQGNAGCAAVQSLATSFPTVAGGTAPALEYGISLTMAVGPCPTGLTAYPATVDIVVTATQHAGTPEAVQLSRARQLVFVESP